MVHLKHYSAKYGIITNFKWQNIMFTSVLVILKFLPWNKLVNWPSSFYKEMEGIPFQIS